MLETLTARRHLFEAFERVYENRGCRGADGVTLQKFRAELDWQLDHIQASLLGRRYRPLPLMRFAVPKRSGQGVRYLSVPTVRDRVVQTAVYLLTRQTFEAEFSDNSFAYRPGRSVRDAVDRVRGLRDQGYRWVVDADIDSFFDRVDHGRLLDRVGDLGFHPYIEELFRLWIQAEVYDGAKILAVKEGIPQGSVVSPMLSNLFLGDFDDDLSLYDQKAVRYGDDFIVLCKDEGAAKASLGLTEWLLEEMELEIDPEKSTVTSFERGFKFLGVIFLGNDTYRRLPAATKKERSRPDLPPPLDLLGFLELQGAA